MNSKTKVIKLTIMLIATLLTLVTVTFAWFIAINKTDPIILVTGSLKVDADLYIQETNGEYVIVDDEDGLHLTNVIPGIVYNFKIDIENLGSIPGELSVSIINIKYSDPIMEDAFNIKFKDPNSDANSIISIGEEVVLVFDKFVLNEATIYSFFFSIEGKEHISSLMNGQSVDLTSFLITLNQIRP